MGIRPTTDAIREMLFASLADRVEGARFADLYAGCGSVGVEALSRGADQCVFVEKDARCVQAITTNLANTQLSERAVVVHGTVERLWTATWQSYGPFDLVFADPPYRHGGFVHVLRRLVVDWEGVVEGGLVVVQCNVRLQVPNGAGMVRVKRAGDTELRFFDPPLAQS